MTTILLPEIEKCIDEFNLQGYKGEALARILIEYKSARQDMLRENPKLLEQLEEISTVSPSEAVKFAAESYHPDYRHPTSLA